jgi:hypothetical protein
LMKRPLDFSAIDAASWCHSRTILFSEHQIGSTRHICNRRVRAGVERPASLDGGGCGDSSHLSGRLSIPESTEYAKFGFDDEHDH